MKKIIKIKACVCINNKVVLTEGDRIVITKKEHVKEEKKLHENFSYDSDIWFDDIIDTNDKLLRDVAEKIYNKKLNPTEAGFKAFKKLVRGRSRYLDEFIDAIDSGKYRSEFGAKYSDARGTRVSQTSELFSLFVQAVTYSDYLK